MSNKIFSGNLRRHRKEQGLTQHRLADLSGVSRAAVAAIERGRFQTARVDTAERLASALGISVGDLLDPHKVTQ